MTSRERMAVAMRGGTPDRVPVLCQLALGHYFLHAGRDAIDVWHDTGAFAEALVTLQRRYGFDGILVNLPGRDPAWRSHVREVREADGERFVVWSNGWQSRVPPDDNPHVVSAGGEALPRPALDQVEPDRLYYVEPHDLAGVTFPASWGFDGHPAAIPPAPTAPPIEPSGFFPPWHWDTLSRVRAMCPDVSVHGEVFSPFSQLVELVGIAETMLALCVSPAKVVACLDALCQGTVELMLGHARAGADAVLVSSAYAGGGFISPADYRRFVMPFERRVIDAFKSRHPNLPVYTHTCGRLGDRLELLAETGTRGIDTLDPPPLGNVDLADAKRRVGGQLFLKGNVDPVNTVLNGTPEQVTEDARRRMDIAMPGGGYILSTACSVPPHAPPENVVALAAAADRYGWY